jgi:hypothetical protein
MGLISFLEVAGRILRALCVFYDKIKEDYRESKKAEVRVEINQINQKRMDGTLTDDDIRAFNKRLRDKTTKTFLP